MLVRMPLPAVTWMGLLVASTVAVEVRTPDWLVTPIQTPATAVTSSDGKELVLSNGLIHRTFPSASQRSDGRLQQSHDRRVHLARRQTRSLRRDRWPSSSMSEDSSARSNTRTSGPNGSIRSPQTPMRSPSSTTRWANPRPASHGIASGTQRQPAMAAQRRFPETAFPSAGESPPRRHRDGLLRDVPGNSLAREVAGDPQRRFRGGPTQPFRQRDPWRLSNTNPSWSSPRDGSIRTSTSKAITPSEGIRRIPPMKPRTGCPIRNMRRRSTISARRRSYSKADRLWDPTSGSSRGRPSSRSVRSNSSTTARTASAGPGPAADVPDARSLGH